MKHFSMEKCVNKCYFHTYCHTTSTQSKSKMRLNHRANNFLSYKPTYRAFKCSHAFGFDRCRKRNSAIDHIVFCVYLCVRMHSHLFSGNEMTEIFRNKFPFSGHRNILSKSIKFSSRHLWRLSRAPLLHFTPIDLQLVKFLIAFAPLSNYM